MTSLQQGADFQRQRRAMTNEVRSFVEGWQVKIKGHRNIALHETHYEYYRDLLLSFPTSRDAKLKESV